MKQVTRSLPVKLAAVILCVLLSFGCLFCGIMILTAESLRLFDEPYSSNLPSRLFEDLFLRDGEEICFLLQNGFTDQLETEYAPENTNLRFAAYHRETGDIAANDPRFRECILVRINTQNTEEALSPFPTVAELPDLAQPLRLYHFDAYVLWVSVPRAVFSREQPAEHGSVLDGKTETPTADGFVDLTEELPLVNDDYRMTVKFYYFIEDFRYPAMVLLLVFGVLLLLDVIYLCCSAGRHPNEDQPRLNFADRIPFDLYAAALCGAELFLTWLGAVFFSRFWDWHSILPLYISLLAFIVFVLLGLALLLSFCTRVKVGGWWRNTLLYLLPHGLFRLLAKLFLLLSATWRIVLLMGIAALCLLLPVLFNSPETAVVLFLLFYAGFTLAACLLAQQYDFIQKSVLSMSEGKLDKPIETKKLFGSFRLLGDRLNDLGHGMSLALEQRLRSERLKTELITNVSHDIKTPLTSIINYVDLVQKTEDPAQRQEYLAVLDRQAKRLKKLTVDLIDASKAATGNMAVELAPTDALELIDQACGEYEDRFRAAELTCVVTLPDAPLFVMADGWLLWRVLDNLLNNACKYSQQGTRLYIDVKHREDQAIFLLKNTSRQQLNLSPDELLERFVRGDSSRSTEGSGLGLDIAKSLMELQHGQFGLEIDGDLFKVRLSLPCCRPEKGDNHDESKNSCGSDLPPETKPEKNR